MKPNVAVIAASALLSLTCARQPVAQRPAILPAQVTAEEELVAVVVTMAGCCASVMEPLRGAMDTLREQLGQRARREGLRLRMIGVSLDWDPAEGWAHLQKLGSFDEVAVGGNWGSLAAQTLLWRDTTVAPTVPQLIIYRQALRNETDSTGSFLRVAARHGVRSFSGAPAIREWIVTGAPMD